MMTSRYTEAVEPLDVSPISSRLNSSHSQHHIYLSELQNADHNSRDLEHPQTANPFLDTDSFQDEKGYSGMAWEWKNFRRFPWTALWALFMVAGATFACIGILVGSDGKIVEDWPISPSVWLAVLSATANASLRYALSEAVNVAWWLRALKGGSIHELQHYWLFGTSLYAATTAGRKFNLIALASIAVTVLAIDGALLQRASTTIFASRGPIDRQVNATVATHLPFGYTGFETMSFEEASNVQQAYLRDGFQSVMKSYTSREPISASGFTGCRGSCRGTVQAAGLYADCSQSETQIIWASIQYNDDTSFLSGQVNYGTAFSVDLSWSETQNTSLVKSELVYPVPDDPTTGEPFIKLEITYSQAFQDVNSTNTVSGSNITQVTCQLYSATRAYPILISGNPLATSSQSKTIALVAPSVLVPNSIQNLKQALVESADDWDFSRTGIFLHFFPQLSLGTPETIHPIYETLSGLASSAQDLFRSNVSLPIKPGQPVGKLNNSVSFNPDVDFFGSLAMQSLRQDSPRLIGNDQTFGLSFDDPSPAIFSALDEIMFRAAVDTAHDNTMQFANVFINESFFHIGPDDIVSLNSELFFTHNLTAFPKPQLITMQETRQVQVFESHYQFLGIAMGVMSFAALVITPIFNGFWRLGRHTSLSPFETAKAFGAPLFDEGGSNASARQLVKDVNVGPVRYGEIIAGENEYGGKDGGVGRRRLGIAAADVVIEPERGTLYH